jgi:hypothetical protein
MFNKTNGVKFNLSVLFSKSNVKMIKNVNKSFVPKCGKSLYQKVVFAPSSLAKDVELLNAVER